MKHKESDLQIRCIKWFRYQFPAFARLMEHPKNEGNGNRRQGAIAKAEGVQPGVADVILHVPSYRIHDSPVCCDSVATPSQPVSDCYHSLAVELKTKAGTQSPSQRQWQRLYEAAGGRYVIIRSYDDFVSEVTRYMLCIPLSIKEAVVKTHTDLEREADRRAKEQFYRILNK